MLTLKQAQATCRAIGCRLTYNSDTGEYRVTLMNDPNAEAAAYYTNDRDDAVDTAFAMAHSHAGTH